MITPKRHRILQLRELQPIASDFSDSVETGDSLPGFAWSISRFFGHLLPRQLCITSAGLRAEGRIVRAKITLTRAFGAAAGFPAKEQARQIIGGAGRDILTGTVANA